MGTLLICLEKMKEKMKLSKDSDFSDLSTSILSLPEHGVVHSMHK